jgi:hypothetical protein
MIEKVSDTLAINFPWIPDMVQAYKFELCVLCEEERKIDPDFDNKACRHCARKTKMMCWTAKK